MNEPSSEFDPVDDLVEEFLERYRRGERPSLTEYTAHHPELAERIRALFPALVVIEELGSRGGPQNERQAAGAGTAAPMPQRLGDYLLLRPIGSGGMGMVYEAIQESLGRHVALKTLPFHQLGDATRLERFRREARAAARLHHTHIVPVFGVGEHEGLHYYTMQFIRGHGLDTVLQEVKRLRNDPGAPATASAPAGQHLSTTLAHGLHTGRFPVAEVERERSTGAVLEQAHRGPAPAPPATLSLSSTSNDRSELSDQPEAKYVRSVARIGVQVAEALEYAHQQGVLHRDIKPSNLLLDADGEVWVTDFGLAKAQGSDELTRTGDIVGTLRYMAPERFDGWSDPRSDVYALGATLYELLALRPAFDEPDRVKLIDRVLHASAMPLRQVNRQVPRDLETVVLKALAKEPGERYATAGQLAEDLQRFVVGKPILARRSSAIERLWRWSRRNPFLAGAIGTVAAALVFTTVIAVLYAERQNHFATEQEKTNREITRLNDDLGKERGSLAASLAASNRLLAIRNFDRGQAAFEEGEIGPGMLWMVESWRSAVVAGDPVWQHAARATLAAWRPHHARLKAVLSHESRVNTAAFSPDGKTILTGGDDHTARLWDAATGRPIGKPIRHDGEVLSVAFGPEGKTILTGSQDRTARHWDAVTGQPVGSPFPHGAEVMAVAYSPDGRTILTGSLDNSARLWDVAASKPICRIMRHDAAVFSVAFSPDGKSILTGGGDHAARLWNVGTGQPIALPLGHRAVVLAVAYSPDSKSVLTGSGDLTVQSWDAATGKPVGEPIQHRMKVRAVAFSPDGRTILTGSDDKTARLWDAVTNQPIGRPLVHQGPVVAVAYSRDGKSFLTASGDRTVRLWDADPGQPFGLIIERQDVGQTVAFCPDGKSIFSGYLERRGTVMRWDTATGEIFGPTMQHQGSVMAVAVSQDGTRLLTGSIDGTARLWNVGAGQLIGSPLRHEGVVSVVAFSSDGKTIMTGGHDRMVRLWVASTGTPLGQPIPQAESVDAVAFSPDGKSFIAGCSSGSAQLWDLATRTPLGQPFSHPGSINAATFSPDGKTLLTGCEDGAARLWDVEAGRLRTAPLLHPAWVLAVAFSPDGKFVLTSSRDQTVRLWDAATGMPLGPPIPHPTDVTTVAFSPNGNSFLTGAFGHVARLFRKVSELPDDLARVANWVEVLTGLTLDPGQGTIQVLDNTAWRTRREQLEQRGGPPETGGGPRFDPILFGTVPTDRGRVLMERGRWVEAEAAFDEFVRARPYNASSWIARGRFRIAWGQPEKATPDFAAAIRLQPENLGLRHSQALSLLSLGDQIGARQVCSDLLGRYFNLKNPSIANAVAWSCVLGPDLVADRDAPVRLAELAVKGTRANQRSPFLNTLGATLYRAGRYEESIRRLEEGIGEQGGKSTPQDWVFLALAHHQLGHGAVARCWLDRFQTYKVNEKPNAFWNELEIRLLRREAESLILYDPIFPRDPFASPLDQED